jgi:F0F1-type ATP synthase assembly protein I
MLIGRWADARLGTEPWLALVGALLGIAVGFYSMFKRVGLIGRGSGKN